MNFHFLTAHQYNRGSTCQSSSAIRDFRAPPSRFNAKTQRRKDAKTEGNSTGEDGGNGKENLRDIHNHAFPSNNPKGIAAISPGLRGTSYPGNTTVGNHQPQRGCISSGNQ